MHKGLRSPRERALQTLLFEATGLALMTPLFAWATGNGVERSLGTMAALSLAAGLWAALYNSGFDRLERQLTGRLASQRPHRLRLLHCLGFECSAVALTAPLLHGIAGLQGFEVLAANAGLTLAYAAYGYGFHLAYDRLRPMAEADAPVTTAVTTLAPRPLPDTRA